MQNKSNLPDSGLVIGIKAGEEWAFRAAFDRYYHRLLRFATHYLSDNDIAEDIVQDTFVLLWENRATLHDNTENLFSFLAQVVKLKMLNSLEKKRRRYQIEQRLASQNIRRTELDMYTLQTLSISNLYVDEITRLVNETLADVPAQTRTIFNLSRELHLSNKEIADRIGKTEKTIEYHISKVLKLLRPALADYLKALLLLLHL